MLGYVVFDIGKVQPTISDSPLVDANSVKVDDEYAGFTVYSVGKILKMPKSEGNIEIKLRGDSVFKGKIRMEEIPELSSYRMSILFSEGYESIPRELPYLDSRPNASERIYPEQHDKSILFRMYEEYGEEQEFEFTVREIILQAAETEVTPRLVKFSNIVPVQP